MINMIASCVVDCEFLLWSGQTKHNKIGICCFSAQHAALRSKSRGWLTRNQDNLFDWIDNMFIHRLLFQ
jgi:hypothetical protein